ncbi:MAG: hypothetical protein CMD90_03755 [Gammaproteobacteria bacterium]|nr:hypothetical protein [Gammaproteobacteria bacterium]|tara:strand:+ start:3999 stop:4316 length:318 start_codon:yes stop_codon:yes gene_type:complete
MHLNEIPPLRLALILISIIYIIFAQNALTTYDLIKDNVISGLILPATLPIIFFVILLDLLMLFVKRSDCEGKIIKKHLSKVIFIEIVLLITLTARWWDYYASIFS